MIEGKVASFSWALMQSLTCNEKDNADVSDSYNDEQISLLTG